MATLPPGEPAPAQLVRPSGLSRHQQMLLAHRLSDLPVFPAYCADDGGLVLDRALASVGRGWGWLTVVGRMR